MEESFNRYDYTTKPINRIGSTDHCALVLIMFMLLFHSAE